MTSISLPGASGSSLVRSVFTCWACVAVANPKVKINTERMSFFTLCIASVLSLMCRDNRKVRLRQTVNAGANCRFREIFVEQFNSIARFKISHCTPLSLSASIARTRDVKLTLYKKCNTQSFPVVCDSPSPGTSWRNRENPAPPRVHVSATIGTEIVATLVKVRRVQLCSFSELTFPNSKELAGNAFSMTISFLLCGRETRASASRSDPLLLPARNGRCRGGAVPPRECLSSRVQHPPP